MANFTGHKQRPVLCYDHPLDIQLLWELLGKRAVGWKVKLISPRIDHAKKEEYFRLFGGHHHALHDARSKNRVPIAESQSI
ncbi:hypothetical protein [Burkholderia contaminans]|uniref:hypothetical protein n=1 Tax=Burkholderia contaminans TaxID=488447 RepID=UPI0015844592|nr:hypothetical protein [Burkholderia contaminans]